MAQNKGLLFYYDWKLPFETLSGDDFKSLFLAMLDYSRDGTPPPEFEGAAEIAAAFVFPTIDRAKEAAEAGRRGGLKAKKMREEKPSPAERGIQGGTKGTVEGSPTTIRYNTNTDTNTIQYDTDNNTADTIGEPSPDTADAKVDKVFDRYTELCPSLNEVRNRTAKRREAVRMLLEHYTVDEIMEGFRKAESNPFLCGGGKNGWKADFDWLIQEEHFTKILEGGYENWQKNNRPREAVTYTEDDFFTGTE
ncbi:MAG: hypothetical protein J6N32_01665 [Clostridia bacterium]|nr:hypothetical protein [Clostridia bacterium]